MWYFAWLLGLPLAAAFAVLNAMWYELMDDEATRRELLAGRNKAPLRRFAPSPLFGRDDTLAAGRPLLGVLALGYASFARAYRQ